jgi:hypothetical protein
MFPGRPGSRKVLLVLMFCKDDGFVLEQSTLLQIDVYSRGCFEIAYCFVRNWFRWWSSLWSVGIALGGEALSIHVMDDVHEDALIMHKMWQNRRKEGIHSSTVSTKHYQLWN